MCQIVGITGGVACGKSSFATLISKSLGADVVDTDALAKRLMSDDPEIRHAIRVNVSPRAYLAEGGLDTKWIRDTVFTEPDLKRRLEAIVHPAVREGWMRLVATARSTGAGLIVEIPLLYEVHAEPEFDVVVVVAASSSSQISRLVIGRNLSPTIARNILASQMDISDKVKRADRVVWNDSGLDLLKRQAELLSASFLNTPSFDGMY
jgi:dephospho-CoA kinase